MTIQSILEQAGGSLNRRTETCRLRPLTIGRREVGVPGILHGLTIRETNSKLKTSFGWPGETSGQTTGTVHRDTSHMPRLSAHSSSQFVCTICSHAHSQSITQHAWLKIASLGGPQDVCHPRVMFCSLPHLTLTTSTSSL